MFHRSVLCRRPFFALRPPPAVARRIAAAAELFGHRVLPPERLHITLFILDDLLDLPPALVGALLGIGQAVALAPFAVTLDRLVGSQRSVALRPSGRDAGLAALHGQLAALARAACIDPRDGWRFSPHLTLGYRDGVPSSERVAPVGWVADELVLIDSHVGATRHETLGRWPLRQGAGQLALW